MLRWPSIEPSVTTHAADSAAASHLSHHFGRSFFQPSLFRAPRPGPSTKSRPLRPGRSCPRLRTRGPRRAALLDVRASAKSSKGKKAAAPANGAAAASPFAGLAKEPQSPKAETPARDNGGVGGGGGGSQEKAGGGSDRGAGKGQAPPRITKDVGYNLRMNTVFKDMLERRQSGPRPPTAYRRKRLSRSGVGESDAEESDGSGSDSEDGGGRSSSANPYSYMGPRRAPGSPPVYLVDGYNVCGAWPRLRKVFMRGDLQEARLRLVSALAVLASVKGVRMIAVFDALKSGRPTSTESFNGVQMVFASLADADAWIEREVMLLKQEGCAEVFVFTGDRVQHNTVTGTGAFVWSPTMLLREVKEAQKELEQMILPEKPHSFEGKILEDNMDERTRSSLLDLRKELIQAERENGAY